MIFQNVSEGDSFRYSQTVMVVREFIRNGIDFRTPLPIFGESSFVPFEFPIFQGIASIVGHVLHLNATSATRFTGLIFFQLTAFLIFKLGQIWFSRETALLAIVFFEFTPFALKFAHAPMIEFSATFFLLAGVFCSELRVTRKLTAQRILLFFSSLCFLILGSLIKATTALPLLLLLLIPFGKELKKKKIFSYRDTNIYLYCIQFIFPIILVALWNKKADSFKSLNPISTYLRSDSPSMRAWNFGSISQRFSLNTWRDILFQFLGPICLGYVFLMIISIYQLKKSEKRKIFIFLNIVVLVPILVLTNLYVSHEYYVAAIFPIIVILLARGLSLFSQAISDKKQVKFYLSILILAGTYDTKIGLNYLGSNINHGQPPALVSEIQSKVPNNAVILYLGCDWNPEIPFYVDQPALMVPEWNLSPRQSDLNKVGYIAFCDFKPQNRSEEFQRFFKSLPAPQPISKNIYKIVR
jgi:hypothetical protein